MRRADGRPPVPTLQPKDRLEWRRWLKANHARAVGLSLVLIKKGARGPGILYEQAVEESLCFGG
jgi:hypothetical protein